MSYKYSQLTVHNSPDGNTTTYKYKRITFLFREKQAQLIDEAYKKYLSGTGCMKESDWLKQIILDTLNIK